MTRPSAAAGSGARRTRCPRCGSPVLRQLVGRRAALDVAADDTRYTAAAAEALREPNRLDWCLRQTRDGLDLRWAECHRRSSPCPHEHVIDHQCTAPPASQGWSRKTSPAPAGQLTL
ncbi:hypothetical protein [Streptomyces sp. ADI95-17]|uniref:hypothetical protein n=1 Tax=Streptomyces sp. ADI95-17 TaxID=1522759 RepID=UPI000F5BAA04|nr:hypothetical protein [Streptomyces sp. ADI95-17]RPK74489.1 hypothetical protein EES42_08465 [Streptomyces sp. ADI95-17]